MSNEIIINKYRRDDLVIKEDYVIFVGIDNTHWKVRCEPRNIRRFASKNNIADFDKYLFIPKDICPKYVSGYIFPQPIDSQPMPKWKWLQIKKNHPLTLTLHEMACQR